MEEAQVPSAFGQRLLASKANEEATINPANSAEQRMEIQKEARTRIPMSVPRAKLSTPELPGFHSHWLNDYPGRILQAQAAGYDFVSQEEALITMPDLAGSLVGAGTDMGSRVSLVVGRNDDGSPLRAYLMKLPIELYKEDQAVAQEHVDNIHDAMQQGKLSVDGERADDARKKYSAGSIKAVRRASTYAPVGRPT